MKVGEIAFGLDKPFVLIAGPCQIESRDHALRHATMLKEMTDKLGIPFIYKSSFDKANRTSIDSQRGVGLAGIDILQEVRAAIGVPVTSDVHEAWHCHAHFDLIQIPAFLCRQTDLLVAAGETGKPVNIKKGQFMAPEDMKYAVGKVASTGNHDILVTERGTTFGYHDLVVDYRSLVRLRQFAPVCFDATHSAQRPGGLDGRSGGDRSIVPFLARAAIAVGVSALFLECHEDPASAPSDGPNMVFLHEMPKLLQELQVLDRITKGL